MRGLITASVVRSGSDRLSVASDCEFDPVSRCTLSDAWYAWNSQEKSVSIGTASKRWEELAVHFEKRDLSEGNNRVWFELSRHRKYQISLQIIYRNASERFTSNIIFQWFIIISIENRRKSFWRTVCIKYRKRLNWNWNWYVSNL